MPLSRPYCNLAVFVRFCQRALGMRWLSCNPLHVLSVSTRANMVVTRSLTGHTSPMGRVLVADWDETITVSDTTALVAEVAYDHKQQLPPFSTYFKMYMDALTAYNSRYTAEHGVEYSLQNEIRYQKGLKAVEMTSISALEHDGFFSGLTRDDFANKSDDIELRPGFVEFANKILQQGIPLYILSINWCQTLIEATLKRHGVHGCIILANDLEVNCEGITTGRFEMPDIRTGYDKMLELDKIRGFHGDCSIVYVGDSRGDILPLEIADTGVIITGGRAKLNFNNVEKVHVGGQLQAGIWEAEWGELDAVW